MQLVDDQAVDAGVFEADPWIGRQVAGRLQLLGLYQQGGRATVNPDGQARPDRGDGQGSDLPVTLEATRQEVHTMSKRVLYQDVIPYETPTSLSALRGPVDGVVTLPLAVYWGPDATADLSTPEGVEKVYENVVREGTSEIQEALLNADLLRRVWPQLRLPGRCRDSWEARFPELIAA